MDNSKQDEVSNQLAQLTDLVADCIVENYSRILPVLNSEFGQYEIDSVHREICLCFLFNLTQAGITLTNHLLEKHLKLLLIYNEKGAKNKIGQLSDINFLYKEASEKYNREDLSNTINACCSKGLITKEVKNRLHKYRDLFRNGFSHADVTKIFGDKTVRVLMGSFDDPNKSEFGEFKISEVPMMQGIAQKNLADETAFDYFLDVHELIKATLK